jgi:hypothetical protein
VPANSPESRSVGGDGSINGGAGLGDWSTGRRKGSEEAKDPALARELGMQLVSHG